MATLVHMGRAASARRWRPLLAGALGLAAEVALAAADAHRPARSPEAGDAITLRGAIAAALVSSPDLAAFSAEIRAREAHALQAGLLPNPLLRAEIEDFAGDGPRRAFASTQTTISLAQVVELGGKRAQRRRVAALERDLAGWDYEARRASVLTEVTRAFVTTLAIQERLGLAEELVALATESVKAVSAQVRAGAVSPIEEERLRVAVARTELERVRLGHELASARAALAETWGGGPPAFVRVRGDLTRVARPAPEETFLAKLDANPDLARWASELERRRATVALEEVRRIPDVTVGIGGRRFNEDETNAAVVEFSVPLPLFDRNQGAVREARERLAKAEVERAGAAASVRSALRRAYQELHAAFDEVTSLRLDVIPRATAMFQGARDAHARGLFRALEVLDAQRTLFELRGRYLESLAQYHTARAVVERLSGSAIAVEAQP